MLGKSSNIYWAVFQKTIPSGTQSVDFPDVALWRLRPKQRASAAFPRGRPNPGARILLRVPKESHGKAQVIKLISKTWKPLGRLGVSPFFGTPKFGQNGHVLRGTLGLPS